MKLRTLMVEDKNEMRYCSFADELEKSLLYFQMNDLMHGLMT